MSIKSTVIDGIIDREGGYSNRADDSGVSQTSHYTVEDNCDAYILQAHLTIDSTKASRFILGERGNSSLLVAPFDPNQHVRTWDGVSGPIASEFLANHKIETKTDVWFESVAAAINTPLEVDYDMLVVSRDI